MNMEYLKKYFMLPAPIHEVPAAPLKPKIGIIHIPNSFESIEIQKKLVQAAKNKELQGIILLIDNNGGNAAYFSALHDLIKKITIIKPVVGLVYGSACSGGYMIACATNYLICAEASNIGSIGVVLELHKFSEQHLVGTHNNDLDAKIDVVTMSAGAYKTIFSNNAPLTETQKTYLKEEIDKSYQYFINLVARNRNLSPENYLDWADAKIFMGFEAQSRGLVDQTGTMLDAEEKVLELIKQKSPDVTFGDTIETVELN